MQYLLVDPPATAGVYKGFASGLEFPNGKKKATFFAYRMPFYMPKTSFSRSQNVEVWGSRPSGAVRDARRVWSTAGPDPARLGQRL